MRGMGHTLLLGALVAAIVMGYLYLFQPRQYRRLLWRLKVIGFAYVAAVLISAALRLAGWGL